MGELLGLSFKNPIRPLSELNGLMKGWLNGDEWGLGLYPHGSKTAQVFKEPCTYHSGEMAEFLVNYTGLWADLFIGHIRKASEGSKDYHDIHPFNRYYGNREWLFCLDGTVNNLKRLPRQDYVPVGHTGGEQAFCRLLTRMKKDGISPVFQNRYHGFTDADFTYIYQELRDINSTSNGTFNCIFTDGIYLFCYRDRNGARELSYLHRKHPFPPTVPHDSYLEIDLRDKNGKKEKGFIVSTKPLSNEEWRSFQPGEMIVARNGDIVARYS